MIKPMCINTDSRYLAQIVCKYAADGPSVDPCSGCPFFFPVKALACVSLLPITTTIVN